MTALPLLFTAALLALTALPRLQSTPILTYSFWGAGAALLLWTAWLAFGPGRAGPAAFSSSNPARSTTSRRSAIAAFTLYWGYYWPPVYDFFPLLAGQLLFAYAFDILLSWSQGEDYQLGWGPFPIVFSTNLFLWFKDEVFYWQFLLIAVGFAGKAFVRWSRDGKRVHIFNPSAFTLAIFSIVLLATGTTSLTWGQEIASTFSLGPRIYVVLFLIGLVVMYFFAITPVTAGAAVTLVDSQRWPTAPLTGVPYFVDSDIPSAVFLGLHLLVTDPSTSPRTPFGRLIFGVLYGLGVFALYAILTALGMPTFYDKLLCVPLLNLAAPAIDRLVRSLGERPLLHALRLDGPLGRGNLAHMAVWIVFFGWMTTAGAADGMHRGDSLPFWEQACGEQRPQACERLLRIEASYCGDNAGWACNELGRHHVEGRIVGAGPRSRLRVFRARLRGPLPGRLRQPARCVDAEPRRRRGRSICGCCCAKADRTCSRCRSRSCMRARANMAGRSRARGRPTDDSGVEGGGVGRRRVGACGPQVPSPDPGLRRSARGSLHHGRRSHARIRGVRQREVVAGRGERARSTCRRS